MEPKKLKIKKWSSLCFCSQLHCGKPVFLSHGGEGLRCKSNTRLKNENRRNEGQEALHWFVKEAEKLKKTYGRRVIWGKQTCFTGRFMFVLLGTSFRSEGSAKKLRK